MHQLKVLAALLAAASGPVAAELVVVDGQVRVRESAGVELPGRGMSMQAVETRFGAPSGRNGPVGQPPITRWDYPAFSVYFESNKVLHAVVRGS